MNFKSLFNFFVNTFLFGMVLLCLVGISSIDVKAQKITIKKDFCQSVGANNTCNGNLQFQDPAGTVNFTITPAAPGGVGNVAVLIDDEGLSSGTSDQIELENNTTYTVCEVVPAGFRPAPRPDESTGGINQTTPPGMPECIRFTTTNSNGNFDVKFLNLALAPTAATALVSGRIRDVNGKSVSRVTVTLTNLSNGEAFTTRTNLFGRYTFEDMPTGQNYLISVSSKRHVFSLNEVVINLLEDLTDANFTALPN